jgi:hypothetical protein
VAVSLAPLGDAIADDIELMANRPATMTAIAAPLSLLVFIKVTPVSRLGRNHCGVGNVSSGALPYHLEPFPTIAFLTDAGSPDCSRASRFYVRSSGIM